MSLNTSQDIWDRIKNGVFIIAEAGKNFIQTAEERPVSEYLANAKQLVDEAAAAGADAIKFQTHNVEDEQLNINVVSPHFKGADRYQWVSRNTRNTPIDEFWRPLKAHCEARGIVFFSTPMSRGAAKLLDGLGVNLWKVGSGDILDFVMLDYLRRTEKPIIISSGMSTLEEVNQAINFLREKNEQIVLLHCVSKYPCPPEELHLGTIDFYKQKFSMPIGFSDHSIGIEPDLVAVAMGATVIEKHFSLDRGLWGSDHKVSMTPAELRALVSGVKEILAHPIRRQEILNSDYAQRARQGQEKILQEDEAVFRPLFRKSLIVAADVPAGTALTADLLYAMRPQAHANGLPSEMYTDLLGKKLKVPLKKYDPLNLNQLVD